MSVLYPIFSGSTGNSYFLGDKESGILIDAGKNCKQLCLGLQACEIAPEAVKAIFVTHEHIDHVGALRVFAKKYKVPVYCSLGTIMALKANKVADESFQLFRLEQDFEINGVKVSHFTTSHDCAESIGFRFETKDKKILSFATDLGFLSDTVKENLINSDFCVIESNHDIGMLKMGEYPYVLKKRILSHIGHLSNEDCANFLPQLVESGTKKIMLAHLSQENNDPYLAYEYACCALRLKGYEKDKDYELYLAAARNNSGKGIEF